MSLFVFADVSLVYAQALDVRTAKECRSMAVRHALKGEGVGLLHVDRSLPFGVENDPAKGEITGYSNVSVVISRESADPTQFEMLVEGKVRRGSTALRCKILKESQRELLW